MNVSFEIIDCHEDPLLGKDAKILPSPEPITMRILLNDVIMAALNDCGYDREKVIKYMGMFYINRTYQPHGWTDTYICGHRGLFEITTKIIWDGFRCHFDDYIHFLPNAEENNRVR